jgi:hypothetical protein
MSWLLPFDNAQRDGRGTQSPPRPTPADGFRWWSNSPPRLTPSLGSGVRVTWGRRGPTLGSQSQTHHHDNGTAMPRCSGTVPSMHGTGVPNSDGQARTVATTSAWDDRTHSRHGMTTPRHGYSSIDKRFALTPPTWRVGPQGWREDCDFEMTPSPSFFFVSLPLDYKKEGRNPHYLSVSPHFCSHTRDALLHTPLLTFTRLGTASLFRKFVTPYHIMWK